MLLPGGLQQAQQLGEIGAGEGLIGCRRLALQLCRQKDQAETVDLLAALAIDLLQPLAHQPGQVGPAQQRTNQGADRGQGRAHLMGERLKQGQLAAGGSGGTAAGLRRGGTAVHEWLQGDAGRHGRQPLRQQRPEALGLLLIALQGAEGTKRLAQLSALVRIGQLQALIQQRQGRRECGRIEPHQQLPLLHPARKGQGHLNARGDHQQQRIGAIGFLQRQPRKATGGGACSGASPRSHTRQAWGRSRQQIPQLGWSPHPALQLLQQGWLVQGRQRGRQPNALKRALGQQEILLDRGKGRPPLAAHTVLIAAARAHPLRQTPPQGLEAGSHHLRVGAWLPRRPTEAQSPRAMKFTSMAERP